MTAELSPLAQHGWVSDAMLNRDQLRQVARLHQQALPQAFLSSLGTAILAEFYAGVQKFPGGHLITSRADQNPNEITGFAAGAEDVEALHRWLTRRHFPHASVRLLPYAARLACSPRTWRKAGDILFYPRRAQQLAVALPAAEFLTLGVSESYRNQRIAPQLYSALVKAFRKRGVPAFRILVGSELHSVRGFHRAMGATEVARFALHAGSETVVLVQSVGGVATTSLSPTSTVKS